MIYLLFLQFTILLILIFKFNSMQNINFLRLSGIPVSFTFPDKNINLIEQTNYIICLSIYCPHCRKIIDDLQALEFTTNNIFLVFSENDNSVREYLAQFQKLNFEYLADILSNDLYVSTTPFVYIVNENKVIIEKKIIKNINSLEIL